MSKTQSGSFGRTAVYAITMSPLLATVAVFFLLYVPSREEYLLNLRFRTLGVMGSQIEAKLEAVSSGLTYAKDGIDQAAPGKPRALTPLVDYVKEVFPGLQAPPPDAGESKNAEKVWPDIEFTQSAARVRFVVGPKQSWEIPLAGLIRPLTEDASFEDVILAARSENKASVLFQRSDSTPRLRDISELLKKPEAAESGVLQFFHRLHSEGNGSDADLLREVDLDGSGYRFLIQPLSIRVPRSPKENVKELIVCGLVRSNAIRQEAIHVPPKYLLWVIVPLFALVLSGPLLKMILIRRTGRFETRDLPMLGLFSCLGMAMLTIVLLTFHLSQENTKHLSDASEGFANRIAEQVRACFARGREVLREVDAFAVKMDAASPGRTVATNRTSMWSWSDLVNAAPAITRTNLEFVFWTSLDGFQIEKWTPQETNTPYFPQNSYAVFQKAVAHQYWYDELDPGAPFVAELLISPTTSAPIAVLTMPSSRKADLQTAPERHAVDPSVPAKLNPALVSIVETPRDLLMPVIPPGMGFALVRNDGLVLYHSDHARILNENLFVETENPRALVDAVATQSASHVEARYRGSDVAFYVRPLGEVAGVPWTIVVFHEIEPWQTLAWQVGLDVLVLYLLLWMAPVLLIPAAMLWVKKRRNLRWGACRIEVLRSLWPNDQCCRGYWMVVWVMCGLMAVEAALLVWFLNRPDGGVGLALLIGSLLPPLFGLLICVRQIWQLRQGRSQGAPEPLGRRSRPVYIAALCLMLIGGSVLPVTAFFHLAFRADSEIEIRHWQWDLAERILNHRAAVETDVRRPEKLSDQAIAVAIKMESPNPGECDKEKLYEAWDGTRVECRPRQPIEEAAAGLGGDVPAWTSVLHFLHMGAIGLEAATVSPGRFPRGVRTGLSEPRLVMRAPATDVVISSRLWDLPLLPRSLWCWIFAAVLLAAGCIWVWIAASRLFLFDFYEIPLRSLKTMQEGTWDHPILVLGLPRSGKDHAVRDFIDAIEAKCANRFQQPSKDAFYARLDLKTEKLDAEWLKQALESLGVEDLAAPPVVQRKTFLHSPQRAAAAAGDGGTSAAAVGALAAGPETRRVPDYVHVTNLEAAVEDGERRHIAMSLLDTLVKAQVAGRLKLVVTSVLDPIFHYDIIFPDERREVDRSHLPEAGFGRWTHLFLQFERILAEEEKDKIEKAEQKCRKDCWGADLWDECKYHPSLRRTMETMSEDLRQRVKAGEPLPKHEQLVQELSERAFPLYKLFWSACTRPEKLLLVQLAQTGLVNPICKEALHETIRKKLVELKPYPRVMNESFARFLESAATSEQIEVWEKEAGESHWLTIRNVLLIMVVFAFLMIGISQDHVLQSISAILTAVIGGIGGLMKLSDTIASKFKKEAAPAAEAAAVEAEPV